MWSPRLPTARFNAGNQLQYSRIIRTVILYKERFWPKFRHSGFSVSTGRTSDHCLTVRTANMAAAKFSCRYAIGNKGDDLAQEPNVDAVKALAC
jgi:monoamine oxidase